MTISECFRLGKYKLRLEEWAPDVYLELETWYGYITPWAKFYDPCGQKAIGVETPQLILIVGDTSTDWLEA